MKINWNDIPNFQESELACSHTGKCEMTEYMMILLQQIRNAYGNPIFISSGYRDKTHPVEIGKAKPGEHTHGMAVDILANGLNAIKILDIAISLGVTRIGLNQKGMHASRFIHIGVGDRFTNDYPSGIWTY